MSFQVGDTVGDYRIIGIVGSGGMGHVFKVEHNITRRVEAMKVLLEGQASRPELTRRFLREIQLQASLSHPNIASVHNAFSVGDDLVMIMELVEGETLERLLELRRIPVDTGIGYLRQALSALSYAHARGVTHRDIKPGNMIITPEGTLKLTDFGLAKAQADNMRLTDSGVAVGSVHYMSPEQVMGSSTLDVRSDIYSLGVVLYEMVTSCKPFDAESAFEVISAHVEQAPAPPIQRDPSLPPALNDAILTALAKKPEERFQSAAEFLAALDRAMSAAGQAGYLPARSARRFFRPRTVGIAAGLAALGLAAFVANRWRQPPPVPPIPAGVAPTPAMVPPSPLPERPAAVPALRKAGPLKVAPEKRVPQVVTLPAGSTLKVRTTLTLSTNTHQAGETFFAALQEPVTAGEWVIAPVGALVEGQVVEAEKGGRVKGRAWLAVRLTRLHAGDGRLIQITTDSISTQGSGRRVPLLNRGAPAVLPSQTPLDFRLLEPVTVTKKSGRLAGLAPAAKAKD